MPNGSHLAGLFLGPRHKALATELDRWAGRVLSDEHLGEHSVRAVDDACRKLVRQLGEGGWLKYAIGGAASGASAYARDTRAVCPVRGPAPPQSGPAASSFAPP